MSEADPLPETPDTSLPGELPPLRVHHLLAWLGLASVYCASLAAMVIDQYAPWFIVVSLTGVLGGSLALTCGAFGFWWRRLGYAFPSEPGHWMIVVGCVAMLLLIGYGIIVQLAFFAYGQDDALMFDWWPLRFGILVFYGCLAGLSLWLAWRFANSRRWMVFFALQFVVIASLAGWLPTYYLSAALSQLEWIGPLLALVTRFLLDDAPRLLAAVALLLATWWDYRDGIRRHWSHWCGVAAWLSDLPSTIALILVNWGWIEWTWIMPEA